MGKFFSWLQSKNINTHSVAVFAIFVAGLYATDTDFRTMVDGLAAAHPAISKYLALAVMVITKYSHSSK